MIPPIFPSFFAGGFECSSHRRFDGRRLDLIAATRHDEWAREDYRRLQSVDIHTARDGIRWHLVETRPGCYDWSSVLPMLRAARETGQTVIWDVLHYGWPDHLDIWSADWVRAFERFASAFARLVEAELPAPHFFAPVNEPSFFAFAGGTRGFFAPHARNRGPSLKTQLARAAIGASGAILSHLPQARLVHTDPLIHVQNHPERPQNRATARRYNSAQFAVWDAICGREQPELGGDPQFLDIVGANYYVHNQWFHPGGHGAMIAPSHSSHRPLRHLLREVWNRYQRPLFLAETGIEGEARAPWLAYIGNEIRALLAEEIPVSGVCLYPICNHPGWDNDRHCPNGLWDYADDDGHREIYHPLAQELAHQQHLFAQMEAAPPELRAEFVAEPQEAEFDSAAREMAALTVI